jgi:hypothetical protein
MAVHRDCKMAHRQLADASRCVLPAHMYDMVSRCSDGPAVETVSVEERAQGALRSDKLQRLLSSWRQHGVAVLDGALEPHDLLTCRLNQRLDYDAAHQIARTRLDGEAGIAAGERGKIGHLQLGLPRVGEYIHPSFVCNPFVEQFAVAGLGDCFLRFVNGNTACPGSRPQQLHVDAQGGALLKLGVYFPLVDVSEINGATEMWLGSHVTGVPSAAVDGGGFEPEGRHRRFVEERRRVAPPIQLAVSAGAAVFRDLRLWHRGTGNNSNSPRHVLALHYCSKQDPFADTSHLGPGIVPHTFSNCCRAAFQRPSVRWPEGQVDRNVRFSAAKAVDHFGNSAAGEPHQLAYASASAALRLPAAASNASATTNLASFNARFEFDLPTGSVKDVLMGEKQSFVLGVGGTPADSDTLPSWVLTKGAHEPSPARSITGASRAAM